MSVVTIVNAQSNRCLSYGVLEAPMSGTDGPKQVSDPDYHSVNHTAAQTCGWTHNALNGDGKCYKHAFKQDSEHEFSTATSFFHLHTAEPVA